MLLDLSTYMVQITVENNRVYNDSSDGDIKLIKKILRSKNLKKLKRSINIISLEKPSFLIFNTRLFFTKLDY